jgi:glycosyltransferase involved in cell wall biosynthesis
VRIAVLSEYFYPDNAGGTPTDLSDLWRELRSRYPDFMVEVITSRNLYRATGNTGPLPRFDHWEGLDIKRLRVPKSNRPSMLLRILCGGIFALAALSELLRRRRYDMVFIVTNPPALGGAAWLYRKITGTRYLYLIHDLYPDIAVALGKTESDTLLFKAFHMLQRCWLNSASCVVVLGRCMKQHLVETYGLSDSAVTVIPSWGGKTVVCHVRGETDFRRRLNFSGTVIIYAGSFSEYARIELFLSTARLLRHRTDLLFVFFGDGNHRASIEKEVIENGANNVLLFPKLPRKEMGLVLAGCEIALISLDHRMLGLGVPSKLYSILAAGCAAFAIVPPESEIARVIEEENCGINIVNDSAVEIGAELAKLADSQSRLRFYGENARHAFECNYTIENACTRFRTVFSQFVDSQSGEKLGTQ